MSERVRGTRLARVSTRTRTRFFEKKILLGTRTRTRFWNFWLTRYSHRVLDRVLEWYSSQWFCSENGIKKHKNNIIINQNFFYNSLCASMMCLEYKNDENSSKIGHLQTQILIFTRVLELKYSDSYSIFRFWQYSVLVLVLDFEKLKITRYSLGTRFLRFWKVLELLKSTRFEYFVLACPFPDLIYT